MSICLLEDEEAKRSEFGILTFVGQNGGKKFQNLSDIRP